MDTRTVDKFFTKKMRFTFAARTKHDEYEVRLSNGLIPTPSMLTVSRGGKELTERNVNGLAKNLGMSPSAFRVSTQCKIGRECVLRCIVARLLSHALTNTLLSSNGAICDTEMITRICESAEMILDDAQEVTRPYRSWSKDEQKVWARSRDRLSSQRDTFFSQAANSETYKVLEDIIGRWMEPGQSP